VSPSLYVLVATDLPAILAGLLAALTCALLGNFLVLRRQSLMGDAISHAVLPGLVMGFLVTGSRAAWPMFVGAGVAGVLTVLLVEIVRRLGKVESGAAMGVVFSILFALGVLLIRRFADDVDLDADCVLHGQLELVQWFPPEEWARFWSWGTLGAVPRQVTTLLGAFVLSGAFVSLLFKELRLAAFDPGLASALGFRAGLLHILLMVFVAGAVVASFEAVGSILVIAMLVCPAAAARMLTDRLFPQILVSLGSAAISAIGGYALAAFGPSWIGAEGSVNAAGMMSVVAGALLALAVLGGPRHGVLARQARVILLSAGVAREDILGMLYRLEERQEVGTLRTGQILEAVGGGLRAALGLRGALRAQEAIRRGPGLALTDRGRAKARTLVRSHRLWETYLVRELGVRPDHVHRSAEALEHVTTDPMLDRLAAGGPAKDPHDRPIPRGPDGGA
jgi:manganese/zinc/iron transport system permease protein